MDGTVLVADDDRTIRTVLTQALTRAGCKVHATSSLLTLMRWVEEGRGDLVITDVVMPDGNGLTQVPEIAKLRPQLPVIVISAQNTIMTAIQAAEADAFDYLPKPFDLPDLMKRAAKGLSLATPKVKKTETRPEVGDLPLVGHSPVMQTLYRTVAQVLHVDLSVLITGESGTGKSLVARVIHEFSDRRSMPLIVATADDVEKEDGLPALVSKARNGTLLFDEVADLSLESQGRLVRMLDRIETKGVRILSTSRANLPEKIEAGEFREDLFFRLGGIAIRVPPLRERVDDIVELADFFFAKSEKDGGVRRAISKDGLAEIRAYTWPGNVRQLENAVIRLGATSQSSEITLVDIQAYFDSQPTVDTVAELDGERLSESVMRHLRRYFDLHGGVLPPPGLHGRILREVELPLIEIALEATGGNQAKCADLLGINRNTLRKKITELDIRVTRRRKLM